MAIDDKATEVLEHGSQDFAEEMEVLLQIAEKLQDRCDQWSKMQFVTLGLFTAGVLGAVLAFQFELWLLTLFVALLASFPLVWWRRSVRLAKRDSRAMNGIVNMLRGIFTALDTDNDVSRLRVAGFRIRLSRFGIGPDDSAPPK